MNHLLQVGLRAACLSARQVAGQSWLVWLHKESAGSASPYFPSRFLGQQLTQLLDRNLRGVSPIWTNLVNAMKFHVEKLLICSCPDCFPCPISTLASRGLHTSNNHYNFYMLFCQEARCVSQTSCTHHCRTRQIQANWVVYIAFLLCSMSYAAYCKFTSF